MKERPEERLRHRPCRPPFSRDLVCFSATGKARLLATELKIKSKKGTLEKSKNARFPLYRGYPNDDYGATTYIRRRFSSQEPRAFSLFEPRNMVACTLSLSMGSVPFSRAMGS